MKTNTPPLLPLLPPGLRVIALALALAACGLASPAVALAAADGSPASSGLASPGLTSPPAIGESPAPLPAPAPARRARLRLDLEVDPTAYVLSGYSLHVGLGWGRLRLDLGAFAIALPDALSSNEAFDVSFNGYGAKLDFFPFAEGRGGYVGVNISLASQLAQRTEGDLAARDGFVSMGFNAGWLFMLGEHLYVKPWMSVSRAFGARDVTLGGSTYEPKRIMFFPAIHVGYRFD